MWALLSHFLNVFVVLLQNEEILKHTLKPLCFVSALFSPVGKKCYSGGSSPRKCCFLRHLVKYKYFSQIVRKCPKTDVRWHAAAAGRLKRDKRQRGLFLVVWVLQKFWQKRSDVWMRGRGGPSGWFSDCTAGSSWWFSEAASVLRSLSRELQVLKHLCGPEMLFPVMDFIGIFS